MFWTAIIIANIEVCIAIAALYLAFNFQKMIETENPKLNVKLISLQKEPENNRVISCFTILNWNGKIMELIKSKSIFSCLRKFPLSNDKTFRKINVWNHFAQDGKVAQFSFWEIVESKKNLCYLVIEYPQ